MGVRIRENINVLQASISNGILYVYHMDDVIHEIDLGIQKSLTFEKQCNFFDAGLDDVMSVLHNDDYTIIIRFDGTIDILTRNTSILLTRYCVSSISVPESKIYMAGSLSWGGWTEPAYILELPNDKYVISSHDLKVVIEIGDNCSFKDIIVDTSKKYNNVCNVIFKDLSSNSAIWVDIGDGLSNQLDNINILHER